LIETTSPILIFDKLAYAPINQKEGHVPGIKMGNLFSMHSLLERGFDGK